MRSSKNIFFLLWPYIWSKQSLSQKCVFIVFICATILTTIIILSVPLLLKHVILALESQQMQFFMAPIIVVIIYGLAWMLTKIIDRLRHQSAFPITANIIHRLCLALFTHLQNLSMRFHHDKQSGKILNIVSRTRYAIADFVHATCQEMLPIFLHIIAASLLLIYYYGIQYGVVLIIMLLLYMLLSIKTSGIIVIRRRHQNKTDGDANAFIVDSILNAETVKYFGMEKFEEQQARVLLTAKQEADILSLISDAKVHLIQNIIIGTVVILLLFMSGFDVLHNNIHVSDFVMINSLILMFVSPLSALGYKYRQARMQLAHLENAFELLQEPIEIQDALTAQPLEFVAGKIEFKHVTFGYKPERIILQDVSFAVQPGTTTAIVGSSGSGKSTIAKLIFRLYDVDSGSIQIDGQDIKAITRSSLCNTIGIVPQDTVMFNDSLENNICYALENTDIELSEIIKSAQLDAFINNLPNGLQTIIGERGLKLSGGERQRLAIARLLARNPKIMVFDEATSALDLITEKKIQRCLLKVSKNVTTIIIAHRLSTIKHADNIIVLDEGKIAEQGTHQELLAKNGIYSRLLTTHIE